MRLLTLVLMATAVAYATTATKTETLSIAVGPAAKVTLAPTSLTMSHTGTVFGDFTGVITAQYTIRTTTTSGSGSITVKATEFTPTTGPLLANGNLTYTCSGATLGTACSGTQTVSSTSSTNVVTVGAGASGASSNSVTISLKIPDNPIFKTNTYNSTLTFTISSS
jgi:hypothetical protein